jgi:hypothetical protein
MRHASATSFLRTEDSHPGEYRSGNHLPVWRKCPDGDLAVGRPPSTLHPDICESERLKGHAIVDEVAKNP